MMKCSKKFCVVFLAVMMAVMCGVSPVFAAMSVNIDYVVQAFLDNPIRAEQTFMNKEVVTEGEVVEITRDSYGGYAVCLKTINAGFTDKYFLCWLAKSALKTAANLDKGSKICIRGMVYDFHNKRIDVIISHHIVSLGDSVITRILTRAELEFREELGRAHSGNLQAQFNVGWKYANGEGVEKNYAESVRWYREAVNRGHALAMNNLGWAYRNGQGVEQNYSEAMRLFRKSAEKGEAWGMISVGQMYEEGVGVSKDISEAVSWYYKAAVKKYDYALERLRVLAEKQNNVDAQRTLGDMFYNGRVVTRNYQEAVKYYRLAAENGHSESMYLLAHMIMNGMGTTQDLNEVEKWYKLAADKGHAYSTYRLAKIYEGKGENMLYIHYLQQAKDIGSVEAAIEYENNRTAIERLLLVNSIKQSPTSPDSTPQSPESPDLPAPSTPQSSGRYIINGTSIPLFSLPNARAKVITSLKTGEHVTLVKTFGKGRDTWCEIKTSQDITGWISGQYITQN